MEARSLETRQGAVESEAKQATVVKRRVGMIPHVPPDVEVHEEARDLILDLAENLYPKLHHWGEIPKGPREAWVIMGCGVQRNYPNVDQFIDAFGAELAKGVDAQVEDIVERREVELDLQKKQAAAEERDRKKLEARSADKHRADLADQQQHLEDSYQAQWERFQKWIQHREERQKYLDERERFFKMQEDTHRDNRDLGQILIKMMVVSFAVAIALLIAGAISGNASALGGSGASGAVTVFALVANQVVKKRGAPELPPPPPPMEAAPPLPPSQVDANDTE